MSKMFELSKAGQSVWYDYIRRRFIAGGELESLIKIGLRGITSNPSIFEKAISAGNEYDNDIASVLEKGKSDILKIYEKLALEDIAAAADLMLPVYEQTNGLDGYVSIEVNPGLAHKTGRTISEARKLFRHLNRKNIMIKVPATEEGLPAIKQLISEGINVNVTLIFSVDNYIKVAEAYISGLEEFVRNGGDPSRVASVASFFVSRIDTAVDKILETKENAKHLLGKAAIANAKVAYQEYKKLFGGDRWTQLASKGARPQRVLWASTGTKNSKYSDTLYVDELIGPDTVNTIPPDTLNNFMDHGKVELTLEKDFDAAASQLSELKNFGVDLNKITDELQTAGVQAFSDSFDNLLASIENKVKLLSDLKDNINFNLGGYAKYVDRFASKAVKDNIVARIWAKDFTVWGENPAEISNRLGWLDSPANSLKALSEINEFIENLPKNRFSDVLLLGMGGSSLAPEVFARTFGSAPGYPKLHVLDSTDPRAVLEYERKLAPEKTLYVVSTKSGGTIETLSFMKYFYTSVAQRIGKENASKHFIAITDPGSGLQKMAESLNFRKIFLNDPNIGGRYSALSLFGIVPAAMIGADVKLMIKRAQEMSLAAGCNSKTFNSAAILGNMMGALAKKGMDKITFIMQDEIKSFGAWVEQLIAESTGKNGKGILPVDGEALMGPEYYSADRNFVYIKLKGDCQLDAGVDALKNSGFPVVEILWNDIYDLGGEMMRWEIATAIAGYVLNIQPFDQPNVESAKVIAREMIAEYLEKKKLPLLKSKLEEDGIKILGKGKFTELKEALNSFIEVGLNKAKGKGYIALQAYIEPTAENESALENLRTVIRKKFRTSVTIGFGPRFLHSTGQLHKGDAGKGIFIQFVDKMNPDAPIPENAGESNSSFTFGILKSAQALGDRQALLNAKRIVLTLDLGENAAASIDKLSGMI